MNKIKLPPLPEPLCNLPGHCRDAIAHYTKAAIEAALGSPEVQALRDALQEVVDAADGDGWNVLDASFEKQRSALAAMEKRNV